MSESESEEKREVVEGSNSPPPTGVPVRETVYRNTTVPTERESRVVHRRTNTAAIVALIIGVLVLIGGIYLVLMLARSAPAPISYIALFIIGIVLIAVGAKLVTTRTSTV